MECRGAILTHYNLRFSVSRDVSFSDSSVTTIAGPCHHTRLIIVFLVETEFHSVGQSVLELVTSGDPPTLASQSAEITGLSHSAQHIIFFIIQTLR